MLATLAVGVAARRREQRAPYTLTALLREHEEHVDRHARRVDEQAPGRVGQDDVTRRASVAEGDEGADVLALQRISQGPVESQPLRRLRGRATLDPVRDPQLDE